MQVGLVNSKLHLVTTMCDKLKHVYAMLGEKLLASQMCMCLHELKYVSESFDPEHGMQHRINNCVSPRGTQPRFASKMEDPSLS